MNPTAVFHQDDGSWRVYRQPLAVIVATAHHQVEDCIREMEDEVAKGYHAAGFVSYEAGHAFDSALPAAAADGFPLVWFTIFKKPCYTATLSVDHDIPFSPVWTSQITPGYYADAVKQIREFIAAGDIYQANFTYQLQTKFTADAWYYFCLLAGMHPMTYASFIDCGERQICSFSPELFFNLDGTTIRAQPMKGTIRRGRTSNEDAYLRRKLRHAIKDQAENLMIVDMVRNDMGKIASPGSVQVEELYRIIKFETLFQMVSTVTAQTGESLFNIFKALFPCASITGAPKIRAAEIISQLETVPRHCYCGAVGWYAPGRKCCFNVAIRTVTVDRERALATFGTGSGIVWDSSEQGEFDECYLKSRIVANVPQEYALLESLLWDWKNGYFLLDRHGDRMVASARYFGIPVTRRQIVGALMQFAADYNGRRAKVRLVVDRQGRMEIGSEEIGSDTEQANTAISLVYGDCPIDITDRFIFHKTTWRHQYSRSRERVSSGDDLLFYNSRDELTETASGNIVVYCKGQLVTPPVRCGLLGGVFRGWLLDQHCIVERPIRRYEVRAHTPVFRINSVRKWQRCCIVE